MRHTIRTSLLSCIAALACSLPGAIAMAADDAFICMEESQEKCDQENKNIQLFIDGRDAFDRGRESGDFSEAQKLAAELMDRKDFKHGKALMKFIYLQLSQGAHRNLVQAYRWVAADIAGKVTYERLNLDRVLEQISARMTPEQLAEAKR